MLEIKNSNFLHNFIIEIFLSKVPKIIKFPYCDGSHGKHNAETGDNVGPLVFKN